MGIKNRALCMLWKNSTTDVLKPWEVQENNIFPDSTVLCVPLNKPALYLYSAEKFCDFHFFPELSFVHCSNKD